MSKTKNTEKPNTEMIKNMEEFARKIAKKVENAMEGACEVRLQTVTKTNQVTLQGLVILSPMKNVSPTIYLEPFWEKYQNGVSLEVLTEKIVTLYKEDTPKNSIDLGFFKEFEKVKDRICYRLIHKSENEELLQKIPHKEFLDLAVCFYYAYYNPDLGDGTILLYNSHLETWGTTVEELFLLAQENTPRLFPVECVSLKDMVEDMFGIREDDDLADFFTEDNNSDNGMGHINMQVLGNEKHTHGAAALLYDDVPEQMAELLDGSYYILPSSVHEVILLKDSGKENEQILKGMIADVNGTQVPPEDVLSNSLYFYDSVEKKMKIV